jgi:hypothetical protein
MMLYIKGCGETIALHDAGRFWKLKASHCKICATLHSAAETTAARFLCNTKSCGSLHRLVWAMNVTWLVCLALHLCVDASRPATNARLVAMRAMHYRGRVSTQAACCTCPARVLLVLHVSTSMAPYSGIVAEMMLCCTRSFFTWCGMYLGMHVVWVK